MVDQSTLWLSKAKFWILLILSIPSSILAILIMIHFFHKRHNISMNQHFIVILIVTSFLHTIGDLSFIMDYYQHGRVSFASNFFCTFWNWWEYSSNIVLLYPMAWTSIERHFIIFHHKLMSTRRKRFFFHLLPLFITSVYPLIFYLAAIVLNPCKKQWNYDEVFCLLPCYVTDQPSVATFNFIGNIMFPTFVITIANVYLILRVLRQKRSHHVKWRRQRKLTKQLVSIAILYIIFWFPMAINGLIMTFMSSSVLLYIQVNYFFFLLNMIPIILPFISMNYLTGFMNALNHRQNRTIIPAL
ncbi:unnamed protein product [Adineta steineri]|uniref:G-protein coupled receptors family 1 profile domain-containing protein n=1 Tax=Adineta steineri TaxID=433720 RepID=A0A815EY91_9BILA|nr:unnamed protein product [Adineta steineri]CAF1583505.1 unnamed protein product [Adineta steineri]